MIIKLTLRKHWLRILFTGILFFIVITCAQLAINLSNSYFSLSSRADKYNASQTEICVDLFYDLSDNVTDFSQQTSDFLDAYPGIDYYTAQVTLRRYAIRYEEYVDNGIDDYLVLAGKQLADLDKYEVAIPANLNDYYRDSGEIVYQLGDLITGLGEPLVVASIIDNIHYAESAYNELTMSEPGLSWDYSYEYSRFLANRDTIDYINEEVGRIEVMSTAFKISFANYSIAEEQKLIDSYITYIGGMNTTIQINPFREVLQAANGSDIVIGKTLAVCSTIMFLFAILAIVISVKHDLVKERHTIGTLRSLGISKRTIVISYSSEYAVASLTGYLASLLFFLNVSLICRGHFNYSLFFAKDVRLYIAGFGLILSALILMNILIGVTISKSIDKKPATFFKDYARISRNRSRSRISKFRKINIGFRYALADWYSSSVHILTAILVTLSIALCIAMNNYAQNIYTTDNYGLDYDYIVISKHDIYSEIMDTYGDKSLIVDPQKVWAIITDADFNEYHVKVFYVAFSGDICDFLTSGSEIGACPPNISERGLGLIGYNLANDFHLEVAPSQDASYMHYIRFVDTAVGSSSVYNIKIYGIKTMLQHDGYVVFDRIGDEADYAGRRFVDWFADNTNRAQYYLKLREGVNTDELETYLADHNISFSSSDDREASIRNSSDKLTLYIQGITTASLVFTLLIFAYVLFKDFAYFYQKRKRDFGIFRSVGLSPASSSFLFVSRYILLSLLSVVMGAGLAVLAMNGTESFVSNNMGVFNVSAINSVVVSAVIAFCLFATIAGTMIVFARNACRMKIADLVRFDE